MRYLKLLSLIVSGAVLAACSETEETPTLFSASHNCTFEIWMDQIEVLDGQGVAEGKLELSVEGFADNTSVVHPGGGATIKISRTAGTVRSINRLIDTFVVDEGSQEVIDIEVEVTEEDTGSLGADDFGLEDGNMTLECGVQTSDLGLEVDLPGGALAEDDGEVEVLFTAEEQ
jgi:hypothetical protein